MTSGDDKRSEKRESRIHGMHSDGRTAIFDGDQKGFSDWVNLSSDLSWERIGHEEMAGGGGVPA